MSNVLVVTGSLCMILTIGYAGAALSVGRAAILAL